MGSEGEEAKFNCHICNTQLIDGSAIYEEELRRNSLVEVKKEKNVVCYAFRRIYKETLIRDGLEQSEVKYEPKSHQHTGSA